MTDSPHRTESIENIMEDDISSTSSSSTELWSRGRVRVVAMCAFVASLGSVLIGMNFGFPSPALLELTNENLTTPAQHFDDEEPKLISAFGVRLVVYNIIQCYTPSGMQLPKG